MAAQRDITLPFLRYRDCSRMIWNNYLIEMEHFDISGSDIWDHFETIDQALFQAMIAAQLFGRQLQPVNGYYEAIEIHPSFGPLGSKTMWAPAEGLYKEWKEITLTDPQNTFRFVELFDWDTNGMREHQYIKARMIESKDYPDYIQKDFLFEIWQVQILKYMETEI
ncbi:MAG: hypothetical protein AAF598_18050 [Bacteroidota bacterium]